MILKISIYWKKNDEIVVNLPVSPAIFIGARDVTDHVISHPDVDVNMFNKNT